MNLNKPIGYSINFWLKMHLYVGIVRKLLKMSMI